MKTKKARSLSYVLAWGLAGILLFLLRGQEKEKRKRRPLKGDCGFPLENPLETPKGDTAAAVSPFDAPFRGMGATAVAAAGTLGLLLIGDELISLAALTLLAIGAGIWMIKEAAQG